MIWMRSRLNKVYIIHQENSNFLKLTYFSLISKLSKIKQIFIKEPLLIISLVVFLYK